MRSLSLRWKIILACGLPILFLVGFSLHYVNQTYEVMKGAEVTRSQVNVIGAASEVVNETQKERGKTAIYLSGGTSLLDLNSQRQVNDAKIEKLKKDLQASSFDADYRKVILNSLNALETLRKDVETNSIGLKVALGSYTKIVKTLLDMQSYVSDITTLPEISSALKSFRIIEEAKESGGKLRANMSGVLAKNTAINDAKFATIINLKAGVDTNLKSTALRLDQRSKDTIKRFKSSSEWATVNEVFSVVLTNSKQGNYNFDAKQFFGTITNALNIVGELVIYTKESLIKKIDTIRSSAKSTLSSFLIGLAVVFIAITLFTLFIVKSANESIEVIKKIGEEVALEAGNVSVSSESISTISTKLNDASTSQASGLQETVSSIDEISSMVQRNADSANTSKKISNQSNQAAAKGKKNVEMMVSSIKEISNSNQEIMGEMSKNNEDINKIVGVISEIGEKTKVINDIVFQTKLLSFNASVEAARAGEHGKGFAVVAEEVGNLAAMSGTAAHEITEMLDKSIYQVKDIADSAQKKIQLLIEKGREKVELGIKTADKCDHSLDEILQNASTVNSAVGEIASASSEQATGVQEITKAMQQLDQITHENSGISHKAAETAQKLNEQANSLNFAVKELMSAVNGGNVSKDWGQKKKETKVLSLPDRSIEHKKASNM